MNARRIFKATPPLGLWVALALLAGVAASSAMASSSAEAPAEGAHSEAKAEGGHGGGEGEGKKEDAAPPPMREPAERQFTPTETQILLELDQRRTELDRREQALELREKLVDLMEQRLNGRVTELTVLKADLERLLANVSGKDDAELKQLASMYGAMKPTVAAGVLNRLDNNIVLDVFRNMPAKRSAKIMESLDAAKARYISELMAERTPPPVVSETTP